jgi:hypothetical protein
MRCCHCDRLRVRTLCHPRRRCDVERNAETFMQAQGLPFSKIKRESGRRNGEERVDTKLLPRKASVNVSHVPQHGCGDDRSDQERQRVLQSGVDNVFHFSSSKQKPRTILTNFFLALSRPFGPELCHSSANAMVSDSATFSFVRDHTTSGLRARPAKRLALLRPMQGAASAARIEATTPSMLALVAFDPLRSWPQLPRSASE